jgi:hypothetical protein
MTLTTILTLTATPALAHQADAYQARGEICAAFGPRCSQALRVASCETGGTFNIYATNGQYWGLFQVSSHWRQVIPGFAWNARAQARHAFKVFKVTGYSWRHWTCGWAA